MWFYLYCDCTPPNVSLWLLLCLWMWGIFFGEFQCLFVNDCSAVGCDSSVLTGGSEHTSFYSTVLNQSPVNIFWQKGFIPVVSSSWNVCLPPPLRPSPDYPSSWCLSIISKRPSKTALSKVSPHYYPFHNNWFFYISKFSYHNDPPIHIFTYLFVHYCLFFHHYSF